jgi:hypothetical protein
MSAPQSDSGPRSNDLLDSLISKQAPVALYYQVVAQTAEDVQSTEDAPEVTIEPSLLES